MSREVVLKLLLRSTRKVLPNNRVAKEATFNKSASMAPCTDRGRAVNGMPIIVVRFGRAHKSKPGVGSHIILGRELPGAKFSVLLNLRSAKYSVNVALSGETKFSAGAFV